MDLLCIVIVLCSLTCVQGQNFVDNPDSIPSGFVYGLESLNVYPQQNLFRYQARCSIPCSKSYSPGSLYITIILDRVSQNFVGFNNFRSSKSDDSSIWWLLNSNWVSRSSNWQCIFDIQLDYDAERYPEPSGTCQIGWNITTACPLADIPSPIAGYDNCTDMVLYDASQCYNHTIYSKCATACPVTDDPWPIAGYDNCTDMVLYDASQCYNHSIYSKCCHTCSTRALMSSIQNTYCPYGDRNSSGCEYMGQHECYTANYTCCATCLTYVETIEDCPYGNRHPYICDYILHSDCYNATTAEECCHECHLVADESSPDCTYGDKSSRCFSLQRSDCYQNDVETTCCQSCDFLYSDIVDDCEYGDRVDDCYDVTIDECESNKSLRRQCCETCHYLIENDCYDDQTACFTMSPSECYDETIRNDCCKTCLIFYDVTFGEDCPFGDRNPYCWEYTDPHDCYDDDHREECCYTCQFYEFHENENCTFGDRLPLACVNISGPMCYNSNVAYDCCVQCSYFELQHLPGTCLYGNKGDDCVDKLPYECYEPSIEDRCCETCHSYNRTYNSTDSDDYDCRYGDRIDTCYNRPVNSCYNENAKATCCQFCEVMENKADPDCPYGDKLALCTTADLTPSRCYKLEDDCCRACDVMVKHHLGSSCKYGDRIDCSNLAPSACYIDSIREDCCEKCYNFQNTTQTTCEFGDSADCSDLVPWQCYNRDEECCDSCYIFLRSDPVSATCIYGDKAAYCANITPFNCYRGDTESTCCESCDGFYRNDLPDSIDCPYGDRSSICESTHSSFCYNSTNRRLCCESCYDIRTNDPDCQYGDKATYCEDIAPRNCYASVTESTCCSTCARYYQPNYPQGCEYGDSVPSCRESECSIYNEETLQACCYTCRSYQTSTPALSTAAPSTSESPTRTATTATTTTTTKTTTSTTTTLPPQETSTPSDEITTTEQSRDLTTSREETSPPPPPTTTTEQSLGTSTTKEETTITTEKSRDTNSSRADSTALFLLDNLGAIVGGVVGGVVLIALIVILALYCLKFRKKNRHADYKQTNGNAGRPDNQIAMIPGGPPASRAPTGFRYDRTRNNQQSARSGITRQESGEEVYDYINPDDVKTVISMPITRRPTLPERNEPNQTEPYLEPLENGNSADNEKIGYDNLALHKDPNPYHQYYVLKKNQTTEFD